MIMSSAIAAQLGDGLAVPLFRQVGPLAIGGLRFLAAGALLSAIARPSLRGRCRADWAAIVGLGLVAAVMNLSYYEAAARLPLGTTSTVEFLGPFAIAALAAVRSRRPVELGCAVLAIAGVTALSQASVRVSPLGLCFAAASAAALTGYVLLAGVVARRSASLDCLALSVGVSALVCLPLVGAALPYLHPQLLGRGAISGCLGIALVYGLERRALRLTSAKTVSVLLSLEPGVAALVGYVVLGQRLTVGMLIGMACVHVAAVVVSAIEPVSSDLAAE